MPRLRVVLIKPSKYGIDGYVERFRWGFMPNATIPYMRSMTPRQVGNSAVEVLTVDEYVQTDLSYLELLKSSDCPTLLALVGVQSHQFQRSLDLAAFARKRGVQHCVIGGPHPMTCDTTALQGRGISFALSEAEMIWDEILEDATRGQLKPVYGGAARWQAELASTVVTPPTRTELKRYVVPMLGLYPARGCPFTCNFCSVIKIAGRQIRSVSVDSIVKSLHLAKQGGVQLVMFTADNFNKYPDAEELLRAMIAENLNLPFFVQCDTQVYQQDSLIELLGRAGCFEMFVGVESFNRKTLLAAKKAQNHPTVYGQIVEKCREQRIMSHFSNILGFPEDTENTIEEHLSVLRQLNPDITSFYVLTPIPGTEQYDDFRREGLINERNLDRYDGTHSTWRHPNLSPQELNQALYSCYRRFYSLKQIAGYVRRNSRYTSPYLSALHSLYPGFALSHSVPATARLLPPCFRLRCEPSESALGPHSPGSRPTETRSRRVRPRPPEDLLPVSVPNVRETHRAGHRPIFLASAAPSSGERPRAVYEDLNRSRHRRRVA